MVAGPTLERAMSMVEDLQAMAKDAVKHAVKETSGQINAILETEYLGAANGWYSAYAPKKYKRHYSIRNLMDMDEGSDSDIGWIFTDDKMTRSRRGGSLFEPVFIGGSHGLPHRSFVPVVTTPVPDLFEQRMGRRVDDIASLLMPRIESYFYSGLSGYKT